MQQVIPSGTSVVVLAQPGFLNKQELYTNMKRGFSRALIGLGSVQLIIGVLCIIFQCVSLGYFSVVFSLAFVGHGIWNGLLFVITGTFGIVGGCRKSRCQVVSFNVLSIISACFASALIGIATPSAIFAWCRQSWYYHYGTTTSVDQTYKRCLDSVNVVVAMESMLAILAFIECIVAIASSAVCCAIGACCCGCGGCCCCPKPPPQPQILVLGEQQQQSLNQWVLTQNQPIHQLNVQASDTGYQRLYTPLQDTEHTQVGSAPSPAISDNSHYSDAIYKSEQIINRSKRQNTIIH